MTYQDGVTPATAARAALVRCAVRNEWPEAGSDGG